MVREHQWLKLNLYTYFVTDKHDMINKIFFKCKNVLFKDKYLWECSRIEIWVKEKGTMENF